jgi:hypothetical protein
MSFDLKVGSFEKSHPRERYVSPEKRHLQTQARNRTKAFVQT